MLGVKHKLVNLNDLSSGWFNASAGRDRKILMIGVALWLLSSRAYGKLGMKSRFQCVRREIPPI